MQAHLVVIVTDNIVFERISCGRPKETLDFEVTEHVDCNCLKASVDRLLDDPGWVKVFRDDPPSLSLSESFVLCRILLIQVQFHGSEDRLLQSTIAKAL